MRGSGRAGCGGMSEGGDTLLGVRTTDYSLAERLRELRGPGVVALPMDARALAALAANPGCRRRAVLDAAGVDKGAVAETLGAPARFGQSRFAFSRGHAFEARVKRDDCSELLPLLGAADPAAPA